MNPLLQPDKDRIVAELQETKNTHEFGSILVSVTEDLRGAGYQQSSIRTFWRDVKNDLPNIILEFEIDDGLDTLPDSNKPTTSSDEVLDVWINEGMNQ